MLRDILCQGRVLRDIVSGGCVKGHSVLRLCIKDRGFVKGVNYLLRA